MIKDLTRWDRRKAVLFIIIAVVTSGFGVTSHSDGPFGSETKYHQGLPFSFYRYSESASDQDVGGHRVFFAPGFILDVLVWYLIAHFAVRFYDNSKLREKSVGFIARMREIQRRKKHERECERDYMR
jgi:hypothetical protein